MNRASRNQTLIVAAATIAASIPLAFMFARTEVYAAALSAPIQLVVLFAAGAALALLGAILPARLRLARFRIHHRFTQLLAGGAVGLTLGLLGGLVGLLVTEIGLIALLFWFVLAAFVVSAQRLL